MNTKITTTPTKTTIWTEYAPSDRNIILITESSVITGVNFWQGIDEDLFTDYNRADEHLTRFVMPRFFREFDTECISHANFDMMIDFIDDAICDYVDRDNKTIAIPSIGQWLYGCKLYPMKRSENGLIQRCTFDDGEVVHLDEITKWPFDEISNRDIEILSESHGDAVPFHTYERILTLLESKREPVVEKPSKTYTIPSEQKKLIRIALEYYRKTMEEVISLKSDADQFDIYDLRQLTGLMYGDLEVTLSAEDLENFTSRHNVDAPSY